MWPDFKQFDDCRRRAPRMASATLIERIIREKKKLIMEVVDPQKLPKVSDDEEMRALRAQVAGLRGRCMELAVRELEGLVCAGP